MPAREALRAMQERLARRLQAGPAENGQARWLAVRAGGGGYLLPLAQAGEIFPYAPPRQVPYTRGWFLGVAHLRGGLWAAVDLGGFVADAAPDRAEAEEAARLITFHPGLEVNSALRVDGLAGLRGPQDFAATAPPPPGAPAWFAACYGDTQGRAWQALCLAALAREPRFLALSL